MISDGPAQTIRYAIEAGWNTGNLDAFDLVYAPACVSYDISSGIPTRSGIQAQKDFVSETRSSFPDLHVSIEELISVGGMAVVRWLAKGTHRGTWLSVPPTGKRIAWGGITVSRLVDKRVVEDWWAVDIYGGLRQLVTVVLARGASA